MGGKAKQVYVEKRRKEEEEWERKKRYGNKGESSICKKRPEPWWGLTFWGKHTNLRALSKKLQKCIEQELNIPTLNEQLLQTSGMSIYEGL